MARVLGLDIGGTSSRARVVVDGVTVAEAKSSSANAAAVGLGEASRALEDLLRRLPLQSLAPLDAACAGAAGAVGADIRNLFSQRLASTVTDGGPVSIVPDVLLVLPAAGLDHGVGLICGTGSSGVGSYGGRTLVAGGWGYLLGDEGSGYWMFRQALRTLLGRADRGEGLGALGQALLEAGESSDLDQLRDRLYSDPRPGRWAALAPVVLASPDPTAATILEDAARALDKLIGTLVERLGAPAGLPVVLAGGLSENARFCDVVTRYLHSVRPASDVSVLGQPPVAGAVRLAEEAVRRLAREP
jgi:N-acetylglucosamine kinase-like BadF-type ATPase